MTTEQQDERIIWSAEISYVPLNPVASGQGSSLHPQRLSADHEQVDEHPQGKSQYQEQVLEGESHHHE